MMPPSHITTSSFSFSAPGSRSPMVNDWMDNLAAPSGVSRGPSLLRLPSVHPDGADIVDAIHPDDLVAIIPNGAAALSGTQGDSAIPRGVPRSGSRVSRLAGSHVSRSRVRVPTTPASQDPPYGLPGSLAGSRLGLSGDPRVGPQRAETRTRAADNVSQVGSIATWLDRIEIGADPSHPEAVRPEGFITPDPSRTGRSQGSTLPPYPGRAESEATLRAPPSYRTRAEESVGPADSASQLPPPPRSSASRRSASTRTATTVRSATTGRRSSSSATTQVSLTDTSVDRLADRLRRMDTGPIESQRSRVNSLSTAGSTSATHPRGDRPRRRTGDRVVELKRAEGVAAGLNLIFGSAGLVKDRKGRLLVTPR